MRQTLPVLVLIGLADGCSQAPVPSNEEPTAPRPAPQSVDAWRKEHFDTFKRNLCDPSGSHRQLALEWMPGELPPNLTAEVREQILASYRACFKDPNPTVRRLAAGLAFQRSWLRDAPTLTAALDDTDPQTRASAAAALWAMNHEPRARALLLSLLEDRRLDEKTRRVIAELLGTAELALDAAAALERVASDRKETLPIREAALKALDRVAPARAKALTRATVCNPDEAAEVRMLFARSYGMEDPEMFRAFLRLLDDPRLARQVGEELADSCRNHRFNRPWPAEWFGAGDVDRLVRILESRQYGDFAEIQLDHRGGRRRPGLA